MSRSPGVLIAVALAGALGVAAAAAAPGSSSEVEPGTAPIAGYRSAIARAAPSVVTVHSAHTVSGRIRTLQVRGIASGVIVGSDGYIVTNFHAVEDASELAVGDIVLAMGNPLGIGQTVSQGIVSAIVRKGPTPIENFIQTDAAINPGNSGGALIDTAGRLVGINTVILSRSGGSEGLGFAIPVDLVQTVAVILKSRGRVARAWLGLSTRPPPRGQGALVVAVERGVPADRAGIAPGDVIVRFGDKQVRHAMDVTGVVLGAEPAEHVSIDFVREGRRASAKAQLAPLPNPPAP